ncbi:hypothetical protein M6B38_397315 [Iris pallida]|uniref:Uncharacterized protein n=1 Tax=Iris pallida TaxID=29817 RepID=A0AAX6FWU4_IRIPA|nr:hypothetical protein M6B38_397315 [Iris pallida]
MTNGTISMAAHGLSTDDRVEQVVSLTMAAVDVLLYNPRRCVVLLCGGQRRWFHSSRRRLTGTSHNSIDGEVPSRGR